MTRAARGLLAALLNAVVLTPALLLSHADLPTLVVFSALVSAFAWLEARGGETLDVADERFPWSALATALTMLAVFWLAALSAPAGGAGLLAGALGCVAMVLGIALRHLAMATLGTGFVSEVKVAPALIERGVYARMRHPSETGLLALTLGAALLFGSLAAALLWAGVLLPLVLVRVRQEDRQLRAWFGTTHANYCQRVRALL